MTGDVALPGQHRCSLARFYLIQFLLICVVSLPTVFFSFQTVHVEHYNRTTAPHGEMNRTWSLKDQNRSACNAPLVYDPDTSVCRGPCGWSSLSDTYNRILYSLMVVAFWLALFATIITTITWARIPNLRKYPHVLRFYLMFCCIALACCKMLPLRIGLEKVFCRGHKYWSPAGLSSMTISMQGALCHYFSLAQSFWAMCFVVNTYFVIVRNKKNIFKRPVCFHLLQSLICWLVPALIVVICLLFGPGYKFLFIDFLVAVPGSMAMTYYAFTLPLQVSLGISVCLLWSIVWCLRTARLDSVRRVIRSPDERISMRRVERQFTSMAVVILVTVGVVLTIRTTVVFKFNDMVHRVETYFNCLKVSKTCDVPSYSITMSAVNTMAPGFLCLVFFSLLFFNKDCRQVWKDCFRWMQRLVPRSPLPGKLQDDKSRSRCSSTLTVLSDLKSHNVVLQMPLEPRPRSTSCGQSRSTDMVLRLQLTPTLAGGGGRTRSCSSPTALESGCDIVRSFAISVPERLSRHPAGHTLQLSVDLAEARPDPRAAGKPSSLDADEHLTRL